MSACVAIADVQAKGTVVTRGNVFPLASCPSPGVQAISCRIARLGLW